MFGTRHQFSVWPARGGRKVQYRCSCGATGYETVSDARARQMGNEHVARAKARAKNRKGLFQS
ncbi:MULTISPECIES: hypothetical protein [unclassified Streptomyces]|uniref:hypothetical protein n=1 Tax=unclassified Streptomyces TaxID=2593676 RepID=UPI00224FED30|nr:MULTISPECIES: hypothetical protein [unclassified Streptomyces]MCX5049347.1 hypothetical protein [Streptomyces sp. NBC_00474]